MAKQLSKQKKQAYLKAFKLFDKNGDGKISKSELRTVMKTVHRDPSEADLTSMLSQVDKDRSGFIDYGEFEQMMIEQDAQIDKDVKAAFKTIDKDGSGFISLDEMDKLFKSLGMTLTQDELKQEMAKVDLNKDGKIGFEEFKKMMQSI